MQLLGFLPVFTTIGRSMRSASAVQQSVRTEGLEVVSESLLLCAVCYCTSIKHADDMSFQVEVLEGYVVSRSDCVLWKAEEFGCGPHPLCSARGQLNVPLTKFPGTLRKDPLRARP